MAAPRVLVMLEKQALLLVARRDASLVHAGFDDEGDPFVIIDPSNLTQSERDAFAALFMAAAANFIGGTAGRIVH